jgi:TonB-dependent SusC/RagA subfamily outer membrane receptor
MNRHPARVLLPIGIVSGLILGCAHGRGAGQSEAAQSPAAPPPASPTDTTPTVGRQPGLSLEQLLAGRISGVTVTRGTRGGVSIRIRGPSSFYLSSEPLYVVDGSPVEAGPGGTLTWLNPQDIASIMVLKDPASTGMYGVRGANGVVVIRTKGSH